MAMPLRTDLKVPLRILCSNSLHSYSRSAPASRASQGWYPLAIVLGLLAAAVAVGVFLVHLAPVVTAS